jgi:tRNA A37 N6-isopentenylltransferase MiaA
MGHIPEGKSPTINYLWPHHKSMARYFAEGLTPTEVSTITGYTPGQISRILNSPLFQAELDRLTKGLEETSREVAQEIKLMATRAIEILDENLHSEAVDRRTKTQTAMDILDRAGYGKKPDAAEHRHLHAHIHKQVQDMPQEELYKEVKALMEEE